MNLIAINELYNMGAGISGFRYKFPFWDTNTFHAKRKSFTSALTWIII
jgi:hypothetical protein